MYTDQKKKGNNDKRALLLHSTTHTYELFLCTVKFLGCIYVYIDIIYDNDNVEATDICSQVIVRHCPI